MGISKKEQQKFLCSPEWAKIRADVISLAEFKCEWCGRKGKLQVHHLTYDRYGGDEEPGDLVCLCGKCHEKEHGIKKKKKKLKKNKKRKGRKSKKAPPEPKKYERDWTKTVTIIRRKTPNIIG